MEASNSSSIIIEDVSDFYKELNIHRFKSACTNSMLEFDKHHAEDNGI